MRVRPDQPPGARRRSRTGARRPGPRQPGPPARRPPLLPGHLPGGRRTEAEARAKADGYLEQLSTEAGLAHLSGSIGVDLAAIDPDRPLETFDSNGMHGAVRSLIESAPAGTRTFRDLARANMAGQFLVGAPEQVADVMEDFWNAGIDGFNIVYATTPGTFVDFIEGVVPVLQRRGHVRTGYEPGPLRQRLFGAARLPERHPGASYRYQRTQSSAPAMTRSVTRSSS